MANIINVRLEIIKDNPEATLLLWKKLLEQWIGRANEIMLNVST